MSAAKCRRRLFSIRLVFLMEGKISFGKKKIKKAKRKKISGDKYKKRVATTHAAPPHVHVCPRTDASERRCRTLDLTSTMGKKSREKRAKQLERDRKKDEGGAGPSSSSPGASTSRVADPAEQAVISKRGLTVSSPATSTLSKPLRREETRRPSTRLGS
jgi:hypothetical protein